MLNLGLEDIRMKISRFEDIKVIAVPLLTVETGNVVSVRIYITRLQSSDYGYLLII